MKHTLAVVATACALSGCAAVFEGTSQDISVNTSPPNASCALEREGAVIGHVPSTPGTVTVRKSKYDITIKCDKPGYQQASYINKSGTTATIAANIVIDILFTAGINSIVDSATGADNKYETVVNIMLPPVENTAASTQPSATVTPPTAATPAPTQASAVPAVSAQ